jgi:hypothetical protein
MKRPANQCNPRPHARLQVVARAVRDDLHTPIRYRVSFVPGLTQPAPGPAAAAAGPAPASAAPAAGAAAGSATSGGTQGRVHAPTATVAIMDRRYNPASLMETYLGVPAARVAQGISWDPADPNQLHMDLPEGTQASVFFWGGTGDGGIALDPADPTSCRWTSSRARGRGGFGSRGVWIGGEGITWGRSPTAGRLRRVASALDLQTVAARGATSLASSPPSRISHSTISTTRDLRLG